MKVIVDTSIWSEAFRRSAKVSRNVTELNALIDDHRVVMLGPIRQELLSGIKSKDSFEQLRKSLRAFPDFELRTEHFEMAAEFYNKSKAKGITGTFIDLLIAAVAVSESCSIFTTDKDFTHLKQVLPLELHELSAR